MSDESQGKRLEDRINELRAEIAELMHRLETGIDKEVEALRPKLKAAREKLDELAKTSAEAWGDLKPGLERAWTEVQKSFNEAAARFKDQGSKKSS